MHFTPLPTVWKRLGGENGGANVNKNFRQTYNDEFLNTLFLAVVKFHTSAENLLMYEIINSLCHNYYASNRH